MFIMGSSFIAYSSVGRVVFPPWPSKVFCFFFRPRKITQKSEEEKPEPLKAHMPRIGSFFTLSYRVSSHAQPPNALRMDGVSQNIWGKICERRVEYVITLILIQNRFIRGTFFEREFPQNWHWHRGHKSDLSVSIWNVRLSLICLIFLREKFWEAKKRVLVEMRNARNGD